MNLHDLFRRCTRQERRSARPRAERQLCPTKLWRAALPLRPYLSAMDPASSAMKYSGWVLRAFAEGRILLAHSRVVLEGYARTARAVRAEEKLSVDPQPWLNAVAELAFEFEPAPLSEQQRREKLVRTGAVQQIEPECKPDLPPPLKLSQG